VTWAKVDDRFHGHSKARRAREALALWVLAMSWCADELTDGAVPKDMPDLLLPGLGETFAARLVEVGLWERTDAGYQFHDWLDYQPSAKTVKRERTKLSEARSKAGRAGMAARWAKTDPSLNSQGNSDNKPDNKPVTSGVTNALQKDNPVPDPVPVPNPEPREEKRDASRLTGERASAPAHARESVPVQPPSAPAKPAKPRQAATPLPDPVPPAGSPARRLYDAITGDRVLGPITGGPGDLAERLVAEGAYPGVDVLAEIRKAGAWAAGKPSGHWKDGRKAILGWLARAQERVSSTPKPAPAKAAWVPAATDYGSDDIDWYADTKTTTGG
jgi:predicted Rdx family selenoprotein